MVFEDCRIVENHGPMVSKLIVTTYVSSNSPSAFSSSNGTTDSSSPPVSSSSSLPAPARSLSMGDSFSFKNGGEPGVGVRRDGVMDSVR